MAPYSYFVGVLQLLLVLLAGHYGTWTLMAQAYGVLQLLTAFGSCAMPGGHSHLSNRRTCEPQKIVLLLSKSYLEVGKENQWGTG